MKLENQIFELNRQGYNGLYIAKELGLTPAELRKTIDNSQRVNIERMIRDGRTKQQIIKTLGCTDSDIEAVLAALPRKPSRKEIDREEAKRMAAIRHAVEEHQERIRERASEVVV